MAWTTPRRKGDNAGELCHAMEFTISGFVSLELSGVERWRRNAYFWESRRTEEAEVHCQKLTAMTRKCG